MNNAELNIVTSEEKNDQLDDSRGNFLKKTGKIYKQVGAGATAVILVAGCVREAQSPKTIPNEALSQPDHQINVPTNKEPGQHFLDCMERGVSLTVNVKFKDSWTLVLDKLGIPLEGYTYSTYQKALVLPLYGQTPIEIAYSDGRIEKTTLAIALAQLSLQPGSIIKAVAPKMEMVDYDEVMGTQQSGAVSPPKSEQE